MTNEIAAWVAAIAAIVGVIVSLAALSASRSAQNAAAEMGRIEQTIKLSLAEFKESLASEGIFASEKVTDLRLKGVDNSLTSLDHRTSRNTDHITMIFQALLNSGIKLRVRKEDEL